MDFLRSFEQFAGQAAAHAGPAAAQAAQQAQQAANAAARQDWEAAVRGFAQAAVSARGHFAEAWDTHEQPFGQRGPGGPPPRGHTASSNQRTAGPDGTSARPAQEAAGGAARPAEGGRSAASSSSASPPLPSGGELRAALLEWTVPQLKDAVRESGLSFRGLLEKADFAEALAGHWDANPRQKLENVTFCSICCCWLPSMIFWPLSCGHLPCEQCLSRYLAVEAEKMTHAGKRHDIHCMAPGCGQVIPIKDAVQFYRHLSKLWKNLGERERLLKQAKHRVVECPQPDCVGVAYAEPGRRKAMCFMCEHQWDVDPTGQDPSEGADFSRGVRKCPKCGAPIEKDGGCDHMRCSKCGRDFSWQRANFANSDHSHGNPSDRFDQGEQCCVQ